MVEHAGRGRIGVLGVMLAGIGLTAPAEAQFTVMGGIASSTVTSAPSGFGTRSSVVGGFSWGIGGERFVIRPGILGLEKAVAHRAAPGEQRGHAWVEIPLVGEWRFPTGPVTLVAQVGGYLALRPRCWTDHCSDGIASNDYGVVVGGGVRLPGRPSLGLEFRLDQGLTPLFPESNRSARSRTLMVLLSLGL